MILVIISEKSLMPGAACRGARGRRAPAAAVKPPLALLALLTILIAVGGARAQDAGAGGADEELIVEGRHSGDVFGVGRTVRVRGEVLHGVMAFGGDLVIEGRVAGDAAAVGGSVIQLKGSHVGGDVMVFGGVYRAEDGANRAPAGKTFMFAGHEDELRELARNPASLLTPRLSAAFIGWRVLAILFWFVVSLALTAAAPGVVSRAAARLQLTSWRVALIGLLGAVVVGPGGAVALRYLPPMVGGLFFVTGLLLLLISYLFGRVVVHAVTGRWLQRVLLPEARRSEAVALLLGAAFWAVALALPFVWPLMVAGLVVVSLGLALTARYHLAWKRA
jgi:hypothetical protein